MVAACAGAGAKDKSCPRELGPEHSVTLEAFAHTQRAWYACNRSSAGGLWSSLKALSPSRISKAQCILTTHAQAVPRQMHVSVKARAFACHKGSCRSVCIHSSVLLLCMH